jgi:hypothetical protein
LLSKTKPEPVPPRPDEERVLIETTDGKTLAAIPATESGARSIVLEESTMLAELKIVPPVAVTPRNPPRQLASKAVIKILLRELLLGALVSHHGRTLWITFFLGKIM